MGKNLIYSYLFEIPVLKWSLMRTWGGIEVDKTILKYDITLSHTPHSHGMTVSFVIDVIEWWRHAQFVGIMALYCPAPWLNVWPTPPWIHILRDYYWVIFSPVGHEFLETCSGEKWVHIYASHTVKQTMEEKKCIGMVFMFSRWSVSINQHRMEVTGNP